jgi:murein DD-endopeptidase MepM/ murein hydrolase activator NlpD
LELSGNFMEPRTDHFHSGLDLRTQGREGLPVKAIADGYVSRIKISPFGYGKAVYIDHPATGHTSVYGHLQHLKGNVLDACLEAQYKARDFSIDVYPEKGSIPVKQGEVIALSGNTGGSGGPHLHFEIRRTNDQHALDPEEHGFRIKDRTPPTILGVRLYPLTDSSRTAPYPGKAKGFAAQGGDGHYSLKPGELPVGYGTVGLAIHTLDRYDGSASRFGVRSIELQVDSIPVFSTRFNHVDFDHNRYCNAHMDYALYKDGGMEYHRCYKLPNNKLRIYGKEAAQGRIALEQGRSHQVRFRVMDGAGNVSELAFELRGATAEEAAQWPDPRPEGSLFRYDAENILQEEGVQLRLPPYALYDDAYVRYARKPAPPKAVAPLHVLHERTTPIHTASDLTIEVKDLPEPLRSKALIVRIDPDGKVNAMGGKWSGQGITAQVKAFGQYTVMVDSVKPVITNVDLRPSMAGRTGFSLKVSDDLSGIAKWRGTLDGQWILLEYEPKTKTLSHTFDRHSSAPGKRTFKVEVTDDRGNTATWSMEYVR